jgi:acetyl-CoA C-acetyltransferase
MPGNKKRLARGVSLVGAGMSKFGSFPEKTSRDLFVDAFLDMRESIDKDFDSQEIESVVIGNFSSDLFEGQAHTAPIMADAVGLVPKAAVRVEDACASSGVALRQGILAIASGLYDVVLVGGVEMMTKLPTARVTDTLAAAGDVLYEIPVGFTFPGFYAAMASAYFDRYGAVPEDLMQIALKNHANGALNDKAQFGVSIPDWMEKRKESAAKKGKPVPAWKDEWEFLHDDRANPMIAWPLRLFDCSPITDGAAAALLVADDIANKFTDHPLRIIGSGQASDYPLHDRPDLTSIGAAKLAGQEAYEMAELGPEDIQVAEVHDCFTIAEILAIEDLGFFEPGTGFKQAEQGMTSREGGIPVNPSGGLKAKGHPVGASGVGQTVEIFKQLRGKAGERQIKGDPQIGLTHNVGATGQTCVVHIYQREE